MKRVPFFKKTMMLIALSPLMMLSLSANEPGTHYQQDNRQYQQQQQYYPQPYQPPVIYPSNPYYGPYNAVPGDTEENDIYKANQHPPE